AFLVGFPGQSDVPLARLAGLRQRTPVLFDAFVSLYETAVEDRELYAPRTLRARRFAVEDRLACSVAHRVIVDTDAHLAYFAERLGAEGGRWRRFWGGADEDVMRPGAPPADDAFRVFVYGSFLPLHGFEYVVRAAAVLERMGTDVRIDLVGSGQTEARVRG